MLTRAERNRLAAIEIERRMLKKRAREAVTQERIKPKGGRERDGGFLAFLRRQPCAVRHLGGCSGPIHAAHIRFSDARKGRGNPGMGTKNHDRYATPLCEAHHMRDQHAGAERAFWERAGLDAYDTAEGLYEQYQDDGSVVDRRMK